ncbi:MAG: primosomal protein N' [Acidobacteria bacterium]|nr:primosomal protein N' [Acidobacteriota bacterium]
MTGKADSERYFHVITPADWNTPYTYTSVEQSVRPGCIVRVQLGRRWVKGVVVAELDSPPAGIRLKPLQFLSDEIPPLPENLMKMINMAAAYCFVSPGSLLKAALPSGLLRNQGYRYRMKTKRVPLFLTEQELEVISCIGEKGKTERFIRRNFPEKQIGRILSRLVKLEILVKESEDETSGIQSVKRRALALVDSPTAGELEKLRKKAPKQAAVIEKMLAAKAEPFRLCAELAQETGCSYEAFSALEKKGWVRLFHDFRSLVQGDRHFLKIHKLTDEQENFLAEFRRYPHDVHLLYGVTGSGKTECYLRAADEVMEKGKSVLYMVPEIGLTPAAISRLKVRFGNDIAILHSGLSRGERLSEWLRILKSRVRMVVGTRSAVFAPLSNPGLIIVDEENDHSYKQSSHPRYNGVHLALFRAKTEGAGVILGSATPTVESYAHGLAGKYRLSHLTSRVEQKVMPEMRLIDMKTEFKKNKGKKLMLSAPLATEMEQTLAAGEQIILFLNRRGYAPFLLCRKCGFVVQCPRCSVTLTVHSGYEGKPLRCHYCGIEQELPHVCPSCGDSFIQMMGFGTQKVEQHLKRLFPGKEIFRADRDTMRGKKSFQKLHDRMLAGEIDILVGTQMIARGHHFPGVSLVGVLDADASLKFPDFRSAERTFSLILQAAGRAGRGETAGRVLIQTYLPDNKIFEYLKSGNFSDFAENELKFRKKAGYPPFAHLISLEIKGENEDEVRERAETLAESLRRAVEKGVTIFGPFKAGIYRIKNRYRRVLLLRGTSRPAVRRTFAKGALPILRAGTRNDSVQITPDVDPLFID